MTLDDLPLLAQYQDTGHRITTPAWEALLAHYHQPAAACYERITKEILELVPAAQLAFANQDLLGILQTDYDFHITNDYRKDRLLYIGHNHITVMLASEASR